MVSYEPPYRQPESTYTEADHKQHLKRIEDVYDPNNDYTVVGHNYMGPGTNIIKNLRDGVIPTDDADLNSLYHDVSYVTAKSLNDIVTSDRNFSNHSRSFDPESAIAKLALGTKNLTGFASFHDFDLDPTDLSLIDDYVKQIVSKYHN